VIDQDALADLSNCRRGRVLHDVGNVLLNSGAAREQPVAKGLQVYFGHVVELIKVALDLLTFEDAIELVGLVLADQHVVLAELKVRIEKDFVEVLLGLVFLDFVFIAYR